jgi:GTP-binding protein Era
VTRSGFIGLAGRPNVGKSTLTNALVGAKVAIVSERPQTTRRAMRGIATSPAGDWQMVLVDLPGVQRPRDALTERMQSRVERELAESDAVVLMIDGAQGVGPGDRFIARTLASAQAAATHPTPVICAVNKLDVCDRARVAASLTAAAELDGVDSVYPVSARTGDGLAELSEGLVALMPEGPFSYPAEMRSDQPSEVHLAELIREQVLRRTRDEIPHAVEVIVQELEARDDGLFEIHAQVWVETESQKAILIGTGGRMVREVGTAARRELERELGAKVFLDLRVRVRAHWRRDEGLLDRLEIR